MKEKEKTRLKRRFVVSFIPESFLEPAINNIFLSEESPGCCECTGIIKDMSALPARALRGTAFKIAVEISD